MPKKRRKYWVNISEARNVFFEVYQMKTKEQQFFELWILPIGFPAIFYWYHTQGTLVMKYKENGVVYAEKIGEYGDYESCAKAILKALSKKPHLISALNIRKKWKEGLEKLHSTIHNLLIA